MPASRSHIVAPLKDHLKPEGALEKVSEVKANYRNLSPSRPVIHKLKDHLKVLLLYVATFKVIVDLYVLRTEKVDCITVKY